MISLFARDSHPQPPHRNRQNLTDTIGQLHEAFLGVLKDISALLNTYATWPKAQPPPLTLYDRVASQSAQALDYLLYVINHVHWTTLLGLLIVFFTSVHRMSRWPSWGTWGGRFSPFGRPGSEPQGVSDSDFSYITAEDLARQGNHSVDASSEDLRNPHRKSDVLVLKHRKVSYPLHFRGGSIDRGDLTIGDIREQAAESLDISPRDAGRIKLFYRGQNLNKNSSLARDAGLRSDTESEILCVVGEAPPSAPANDEDDEEDEDVDDVADGDASAQKKKRRNRKKKSKKSRASSGTATPTASESSSVPHPDATYVPSHAPPPKPSTPAPAPAAAPKSALEQLDAIASKFHTTLVPQCIQFTHNPPADKAKREFEHKKLTETIMAQVLLKLDDVSVGEDQSARARRKEVVKEVQGMLGRLDDVVRK